MVCVDLVLGNEAAPLKPRHPWSERFLNQWIVRRQKRGGQQAAPIHEVCNFHPPVDQLSPEGLVCKDSRDGVGQRGGFVRRNK